MAARAAGDVAAEPDMPFVDKLAAEEASLKAATIADFEFLEIVGKGCNGIAVEVKHLSPANPFYKSKVCVCQCVCVCVCVCVSVCE